MDIMKAMEVKDVVQYDGRIHVITTGAKYIIDSAGEHGRIECCQLINGIRTNAAIQFNVPFRDTSIAHWDKARCIICTLPSGENYIRIQINRDSSMEVTSIPPLILNCNGGFMPEYAAEKDGNVLLIDNIGGIGIYPYKGMTEFEMKDTADRVWQINYTMKAQGRFLVSVFPPREFCVEQSYKDRIFFMSWGTDDARHAISAIPDDEVIEYAAKYTNIIVFTDILWKNLKGLSVTEGMTREEVYRFSTCCNYKYEPSDEKAFVRAVEKAHSLGMKAIVYMSPYYSMANGKDFLERITDVLNRYNLDGLYFDGLPMDMMESYNLMREVRNILGNKILYIHTTTSVLQSTSIYCPFIDTYADYMLRAEHIRSFSEKYLRYVISGYNISNTIGTVCYWGYPPDFIRNLADLSLGANSRLYLQYVGKMYDACSEIFIRNYLPKLDALYEKNI